MFNLTEVKQWPRRSSSTRTGRVCRATGNGREIDRAATHIGGALLRTSLAIGTVSLREILREARILPRMFDMMPSWMDLRLHITDVLSTLLEAMRRERALLVAAEETLQAAIAGRKGASLH